MIKHTPELPQDNLPDQSPEKIGVPGRISTLTRRFRMLLYTAAAATGLGVAGYGTKEAANMPMPWEPTANKSKDKNQSEREKRQEIDGAINASVIERSRIREGKTALVDTSANDQKAIIEKILSDGTVTAEEVSTLRKSRGLYNAAVILERLPQLEALSSADPAKVEVPNAQLKAGTESIAKQITQPGSEIEKAKWEKWVRALNAAAKDQSPEGKKKIASTMEEVRQQITERYKLYYQAEIVAVLARAASSEPLDKEAFSAIVAEEDKLRTDQLTQLYEQIAHEQALTSTIDTFDSLARQYNKAKADMIANGLKPKTVEMFEQTTDEQLAKAKALRDKDAEIETIYELRRQYLEDRGNEGKKQRYEQKRDAYFMRENQSVPAEGVMRDALQKERVKVSDELHATIHYPVQTLIEAEVIIKELGWMSLDRDTNPLARQRAQAYVDKYKDASGDTGAAAKEIEMLLKKDRLTIDDALTAFTRLPQEKIRRSLMLVDMYVDWAKQLELSFKDENKIRTQGKQLQQARNECMNGISKLIRDLFDLQRDYLRDLSGFTGIQTRVSPQGAASDAMVEGTTVKNLDKDHRKELESRRIPEVSSALRAIDKDIAGNLNFENRARDAVAKYFLVPMQKLQAGIKNLIPLRTPEEPTERTMYMTQIFKDYPRDVTDDFQESLGMQQEVLKDQQNHPELVRERQQKVGTKELEARVKKWEGLTKADDVRESLQKPGLEAIDRMAIHVVVQRRLDKSVEGIDRAETTLLENLRRYGNENTEIQAEFYDYQTLLRNLALMIGGATGFLLAARGLKRELETRSIIKQTAGEVVKAIAPTLEEMQKRIVGMQTQLAANAATDAQARQTLLQLQQELPSILAICDGYINSLQQQIDLHDTSKAMLPNIDEQRAALQAWIQQKNRLSSMEVAVADINRSAQ